MTLCYHRYSALSTFWLPYQNIFCCLLDDISL
nr:MAG TPA: hypothetical protein [Caudoviricetes sp.]